jgi:hypothetical protein
MLHLGTHSQHNDTMFTAGYEIHQQGVDWFKHYSLFLKLFVSSSSSSSS